MKQLTIALVALLGIATPANAATILNGSFEEGDFSGANYSWLRVLPGEDYLTGWVIGGDAVDWHNTSEMHWPHTGDKVVDLNLNGGGGTGTLSQTFSTIPGAHYEMEFYLAGPNLSFPDPRRVQVDIAGIEQVFSTPASSNMDILWHGHSLVFQATDALTTLTFSSVDDSGFWGPVLDDVSVASAAMNAAPIPEPATIVIWSLLGLCFAGAYRLRRRHGWSNSTTKAIHDVIGRG